MQGNYFTVTETEFHLKNKNRLPLTVGLFNKTLIIASEYAQ
ncbi:unnamed protein product [Schistosoma curassoni]|uniref:Orphan protein n=1 Tax=Schistosoma curassoni TaxID=6186 RepID=A0A183KJM5_9TREM|nr:unnamed protein product [Schistosoma curassoni]